MGLVWGCLLTGATNLLSPVEEGISAGAFVSCAAWAVGSAALL